MHKLTVECVSIYEMNILKNVLFSSMALKRMTYLAYVPNNQNNCKKFVIYCNLMQKTTLCQARRNSLYQTGNGLKY